MASCSVRPRPPGAGPEPAQRLLLKGPPNLKELCLGAGHGHGGKSESVPAPPPVSQPTLGSLSLSRQSDRKPAGPQKCHLPCTNPSSCEAWTKLDGSGSDFFLPCTPVLTPLRRGRDSPVRWLLDVRDVSAPGSGWCHPGARHRPPLLPPSSWWLVSPHPQTPGSPGTSPAVGVCPNSGHFSQPAATPDICATSPLPP